MCASSPAPPPGAPYPFLGASRGAIGTAAWQEDAAPAGAALRPAGTGAAATRALRRMYEKACSAPETFRLEYRASVERALALIESCDAADLQIGDGLTEETGLHYAAGCGSIEVCIALVRECPGLVHRQDSQGRTPLLWAVHHGMLATADLLLRHSADPCHRGQDAAMALHLAAACAFPGICSMLLGRADVRDAVDHRCERGWTALHHAAHNGSLSVCRVLIEQGGACEAAVTPLEQWTPLHLAAAGGHGEVVRYLLDIRPEGHLGRDSNSRRPLDLVRPAGHDLASGVLQEAQQTHAQQVSDWRRFLSTADTSGQLQLRCGDFLESLPLDVGSPVLVRISKDSVHVVSKIADLEYRIIEYVLEVRSCGTPPGAAPSRIYYARRSEQRKLDMVEFQVPRLRSTGFPIWCHGHLHQFRIVARCERHPEHPELPWQVVSPWSEPAPFLLTAARTLAATGRLHDRCLRRKSPCRPQLLPCY